MSFKLNKSILLFFALNCALLFSSCNMDLNTDQSVQRYTYSFNVNNCDTGVREFVSREAMCQELKNHEANYYCAINERRSKYQNECYDQVPFDD